MVVFQPLSVETRYDRRARKSHDEVGNGNSCESRFDDLRHDSEWRLLVWRRDRIFSGCDPIGQWHPQHRCWRPFARLANRPAHRSPYSYTIILAAEFTPTGNKFNEAGVRREAYNFYFQDAWKATHRLTLSYGLRYEVNSRIHEQTKRTSLPEFLDANGKPTSYSNHQANMIFVVNPQPPYDKDWNGWGPRLALDYALSDHTVLHAGGAITTRVMNLWQENFLTATIPDVFNPFLTAQQGIAVPFQNQLFSNHYRRHTTLPVT